jgi:hypothetical protein
MQTLTPTEVAQALNAIRWSGDAREKHGEVMRAKLERLTPEQRRARTAKAREALAAKRAAQKAA